MRSQDKTPSADGAQFPLTHWSVVVKCWSSGTPEAQAAIDSLCRNYWYPLYAYVRRSGKSHHETQDLIQGYFLSLFAREYLRRADSARGRFRSFLLTDLKFFLDNEWGKETAQKRGSGKVLSWEGLLEGAEDRYRLEPASPDASPDRTFEQSFTLQLIEQTFSMLKLDCSDTNATKRFHVLAKLLAGKHPELSQKKAAELLGISEEAVGKAVSDLRERFRKVFRTIVSQTVAADEDLDNEIHYLLNLWSQP